MPTRNVVLTAHHEQVIAKLVKAGRYQNASEVLREGVRLVEAREKAEKAKLKALRQSVQLGIDELDAGKGITFDSFDALDAYLTDVVEEAIAAPRRK